MLDGVINSCYNCGMIKHREINILRAVQGIKTDAELARRLNLTPANFQSLLSKKSGLSQSDLIRIAEACGVRYVSAFVDENGATIAGGICDPSEIRPATTDENTTPNA